MTHPAIRRLKFDLVGESQRGNTTSTSIIGSGEAFLEASGLSDKVRFVLDIRTAPLRYARCALVPRGHELPEYLHTQFRVCDTAKKTDGGDYKFGIGHLIPTRGMFHKTSHYYLLEPEAGELLWKCGTFVAYLDPRPTDEFLPFSEVSGPGGDQDLIETEINDLVNLFASSAA